MLARPIPRTEQVEVRSPFALRCGLSTMHLRAPSKAAEPVLSRRASWLSQVAARLLFFV